MTDPTGAAADEAPPPPSFAEAFLFWLRLGFVSFGGPAGQIALMHRELVEHRRWISEKRFLHALNFCMVLPGPEAQQLATYIGWLLHRTRGGIVAGGLFVLPSLFILIALSWLYLAFGTVPAVAGFFYGIKPAVTAIVVSAAWRIGSRTLTNGWLWAIAAAAFVALFALKLPFPLVIVAAGVAGRVGGRFAPDRFALGARQGRPGPAACRAVIDDDTATPPHAVFARRRFVVVLATCLALWLVAIGALTIAFGNDAVLTRMAWFFTQAALLTFGGAYAVLPYVVQGAVEQRHWLTAAQMIDGLALGETTPGPLIMVVAFVGFVGGWSKAIFGADALFTSGAVAAVVVTFFTFLPSFMFILLGGPFVESTHGDMRFTAPLTGITAAVVGVIASLAVFFAWHVLWPAGLAGAFEWPAALICLAASVALFRFSAGAVSVIAAAGLAGVGFGMVRPMFG